VPCGVSQGTVRYLRVGAWVKELPGRTYPSKVGMYSRYGMVPGTLVYTGTYTYLHR